MDALAEFRKLVRKKFGAGSPVGCLPGCAVVGGAKNAHGRYADKHPARLAVIDHNGMQAKAARARMPVRPRGMRCQTSYLRPGDAPVLAAKKRGGSDARV